MKLFLLILISAASLLAQKKQIQVIFNSENTKLVRFELDLIKDLIKEYEKKTGDKYKIRYTGIKAFSMGFKMLLDAKKDETLVINGISITDERKKTYDFSEPYMINKYSLMTRKDYKLRNDGRKIKMAYQAGSIYEGMLDKIEKIFPYQGVAVANTSESVRQLNSKKVDVVFSDFVDSWIFNIKLLQHVDEKKIDRYGIMYKKGSILKPELDKLFAAYKKTAKYSKLLDKHFGNYKPLFFN